MSEAKNLISAARQQNAFCGKGRPSGAACALIRVLSTFSTRAMFTSLMLDRFPTKVQHH
jgi:hypothetical protein